MAKELVDGHTGKIYLLDEVKEIYIGRRAPEGHLKIDEKYKSVSRKHARIFRDEAGNFLIEDLGSTNDTQVNGEKLKGKPPRLLENGSKIELPAYVNAHTKYSITYREKKPEEELELKSEKELDEFEDEEEEGNQFDKFLDDLLQNDKME